MVVDLAAHDTVASRRTVSDEVGRVGRGGIGDDGKRRLERMSEVAGVTARFLRLLLAMGEQLVDLLGEPAGPRRGSPR